MSPPVTRPLGDNFPAIKVETGKQGSSSTSLGDVVGGDKKTNDALPWVVIAIVATVACSMAGVSLGLSIASRDAARIAERETRLQRLEVDELKVALQVQGIKIHEGSTP